MSKRIVFTFDERSYESLIAMKALGKYPSLANAVRDALQITAGIQGQMRQGYTTLIVQNPQTGDERVIVIPELCNHR